MKIISQEQKKHFQNLIFTWWVKNKRDLPWRKTHDPYIIHVSEVMLQQTQVSRALITLPAFLKRFPTLEDLAKAKTGNVIIAWKGMGYNRRALFLKKAAEMICTQYSGNYPQDEQKLLNLPGLGKYTTRAILVFAFNNQLAFVDTNIKKIIEHHFFEQKPTTAKEIQYVADQLLPNGKAWEWHQALMDYGALELKQLIPKARKTTSTIPFQDTNRFIRGRIMDMVRQNSWEEANLIKQMEFTYYKPKEKIVYNLNKLLEEGLLEKIDTLITLPE